MRTFAQNQNQSQKQVSSSFARSNTTILGTNYHASPLLHLQRTIGNQTVLRMLQTHAENLNAGLPSTASPRFGHDFSRIPIHPPPAAGAIQTKLAINQPGDIYEQEADRVSEQVMRIPEPQQQCACGGGYPRCQTEQLDHEHEGLQTKHINASDSERLQAPPIVHEVLQSSGDPLDQATREFFEPRFGYDFSHVRVHTDARAAKSSQSVHALAYTVGNNIVFNMGQYLPHVDSGKLLLAHELTHIVQQGESAAISPAVARQPGDAGAGSEKEEDTETTDTEAEKKAEVEKVNKLSNLGVPAPSAGTCDPIGLTRKKFLEAAALLDPSSNYGMALGKAVPPPLGLTILQGHPGLPGIFLEPGSKRSVVVSTTGASLPPIYSIYIKGSFIESTYHANDKDVEGCPNITNDLPVHWESTPDGEKAISEAEKEHCDDYRAIGQVMQHYADLINSKLAGKKFSSKEAAAKPLDKFRTKYEIPSNE